MNRLAYLFSLSLLLLSIADGRAQCVLGGNHDETLCPVHHVLLKREKLKILYGLVADPCDTLDLIEARGKYFPYAYSVLHGGRVISTDSPEYEEVLYCPKCRQVEKTWPCLETRSTPIVTAPRVTILPTVN